MTGILGTACRAMTEGFVGSPSVDSRREAYVELVAGILAFALAIIIIGFFGKYLWNNVVVDLFSFAKPARSPWQIIGLMVFWALVR